MKNLLLLLLLANILYFLWGLYDSQDPQPGTAIINEADLGPLLDLASRPGGDTTARVGAALGPGRAANLDAAFGPSCVTIGPFKTQEDAYSVLLDYSSNGMRSKVRSTQAEIFVGHWVQIRDIGDDNIANMMLKKLDRGGLSDAYLVRTEDEGLKISLGLFDEVERAEKVELQARSLDLPADIRPRTADRKVFFVDVALPPGQGAGAIVAKYGEDKVLLRGDATCPR